MRLFVVEIPPVELWAQCAACGRESIFLGDHESDAILTMRRSGWAWDESSMQMHFCPECLEGVSN